MSRVCDILLREVSLLERAKQGIPQGEGDITVPWPDYPETACSLVVHHQAILRNKRMLLLYTYGPCLALPVPVIKAAQVCRQGSVAKPWWPEYQLDFGAWAHISIIPQWASGWHELS